MGARRCRRPALSARGTEDLGSLTRARQANDAAARGPGRRVPSGPPRTGTRAVSPPLVLSPFPSIPRSLPGTWAVRADPGRRVGARGIRPERNPGPASDPA